MTEVKTRSRTDYPRLVALNDADLKKSLFPKEAVLDVNFSPEVYTHGTDESRNLCFFEDEAVVKIEVQLSNGREKERCSLNVYTPIPHKILSGEDRKELRRASTAGFANTRTLFLTEEKTTLFFKTKHEGEVYFEFKISGRDLKVQKRFFFTRHEYRFEDTDEKGNFRIYVRQEDTPVDRYIKVGKENHFIQDLEVSVWDENNPFRGDRRNSWNNHITLSSPFYSIFKPQGSKEESYAGRGMLDVRTHRRNGDERPRITGMYFARECPLEKGKTGITLYFNDTPKKSFAEILSEHGLRHFPIQIRASNTVKTIVLVVKEEAPSESDKVEEPIEPVAPLELINSDVLTITPTINGKAIRDLCVYQGQGIDIAIHDERKAFQLVEWEIESLGEDGFVRIEHFGGEKKLEQNVVRTAFNDGKAEDSRDHFLADKYSSLLDGFSLQKYGRYYNGLYQSISYRDKEFVFSFENMHKKPVLLKVIFKAFSLNLRDCDNSHRPTGRDMRLLELLPQLWFKINRWGNLAEAYTVMHGLIHNPEFDYGNLLKYREEYGSLNDDEFLKKYLEEHGDEFPKLPEVTKDHIRLFKDTAKKEEISFYVMVGEENQEQLRSLISGTIQALGIHTGTVDLTWLRDNYLFFGKSIRAEKNLETTRRVLYWVDEITPDIPLEEDHWWYKKAARYWSNMAIWLDENGFIDELKVFTSKEINVQDVLKRVLITIIYSDYRTRHLTDDPSKPFEGSYNENISFDDAYKEVKHKDHYKVLRSHIDGEVPPLNEVNEREDFSNGTLLREFKTVLDLFKKKLEGEIID